MKNFSAIIYAFAFVMFIASCDNKGSEQKSDKDSTGTDSSKTAQATTDTTAAVYKIDTAKSVIKWKGKKVSGDSHHGTLNFSNGELKAGGQVLTGGMLTVNMNSIKDEDLKDAKMNAKLVGHLKSPDFFDVAKYPTASFEITSISPGGSEKEDIITGKLTIKGKTEEMSFPAKVKFDGNSVTAKGVSKFDRSKYDVRYGSGKFFQGLGDKMIYDDIELDFDLTATK